MFESWDIIDVYKALMAVAAGAILGMERELKDKAAGLKTISVICLGSCLFTVLSLKIGDQYADAGRIASYVVSGIGFLGAGVIFKDGFTVSGLTTASVIWIAAAIGMAIGFGEVFAAIIFLSSCLIIIYSGRFLNTKLLSGRANRVLRIVLAESNMELKQQVSQDIRLYARSVEQVRMESVAGKIIVTFNIVVASRRMIELESFLIGAPHIESFEL